jgi:KaiB domain
LYLLYFNFRAGKLYEQTTGKKSGSKEKPESEGVSAGSCGRDLQLYLAGSSHKSELALCNLKWLCEEHLAGRYRIQIIDLTNILSSRTPSRLQP